MVNPIIPPALATDERWRILAQIAIEAFKIDLSPLLVYLIDTVDVSVLPYLAEQYCLTEDIWALADTEEAQRKMIKSAIYIHRHRGTPFAVKEVFVMLGLGEVTIDEGRSGCKRDGTFRRDGFAVRGERAAHWAEYRIRCGHLLSVQQAVMARKLLANVAPRRCCLVDIDFSSAALTRNGFSRRDGSYTRGSV